MFANRVARGAVEQTRYKAMNRYGHLQIMGSFLPSLRHQLEHPLCEVIDGFRLVLASSIKLHPVVIRGLGLAENGN